MLNFVTKSKIWTKLAKKYAREADPLWVKAASSLQRELANHSLPLALVKG
jgi:hypothetical protein